MAVETGNMVEKQDSRSTSISVSATNTIQFVKQKRMFQI